MYDQRIFISKNLSSDERHGVVRFAICKHILVFFAVFSLIDNDKCLLIISIYMPIHSTSLNHVMQSFQFKNVIFLVTESHLDHFYVISLSIFFFFHLVRIINICVILFNVIRHYSRNQAWNFFSHLNIHLFLTI